MERNFPDPSRSDFLNEVVTRGKDIPGREVFCSSKSTVSRSRRFDPIKFRTKEETQCRLLPVSTESS